MQNDNIDEIIDGIKKPKIKKRRGKIFKEQAVARAIEKAQRRFKR